MRYLILLLLSVFTVHCQSESSAPSCLNSDFEGDITQEINSTYVYAKISHFPVDYDTYIKGSIDSIEDPIWEDQFNLIKLEKIPGETQRLRARVYSTTEGLQNSQIGRVKAKFYFPEVSKESVEFELKSDANNEIHSLLNNLLEKDKDSEIMQSFATSIYTTGVFVPKSKIYVTDLLEEKYESKADENLFCSQDSLSTTNSTCINPTLTMVKDFYIDLSQFDSQDDEAKTDINASLAYAFSGKRSENKRPEISTESDNPTAMSDIYKSFDNWTSLLENMHVYTEMVPHISSLKMITKVAESETCDQSSDLMKGICEYKSEFLDAIDGKFKIKHLNGHSYTLKQHVMALHAYLARNNATDKAEAIKPLFAENHLNISDAEYNAYLGSTDYIPLDRFNCVKAFNVRECTFIGVVLYKALNTAIAEIPLGKKHIFDAESQEVNSIEDPAVAVENIYKIFASVMVNQLTDRYYQIARDIDVNAMPLSLATEWQNSEHSALGSMDLSSIGDPVSINSELSLDISEFIKENNGAGYSFDTIAVNDSILAANFGISLVPDEKNILLNCMHDGATVFINGYWPLQVAILNDSETTSSACDVSNGYASAPLIVANDVNFSDLIEDDEESTGESGQTESISENTNNSDEPNSEQIVTIPGQVEPNSDDLAVCSAS